MCKERYGQKKKKLRPTTIFKDYTRWVNLQTFSTLKNYPILGIEMKIRQLFSKIVLPKWPHLESKMFIVHCPLFWWKKLLFFNATTQPATTSRQIILNKWLLSTLLLFYHKLFFIFSSLWKWWKFPRLELLLWESFLLRVSLTTL